MQSNESGLSTAHIRDRRLGVSVYAPRKGQPIYSDQRRKWCRKNRIRKPVAETTRIPRQGKKVEWHRQWRTELGFFLLGNCHPENLMGWVVYKHVKLCRSLVFFGFIKLSNCTVYLWSEKSFSTPLNTRQGVVQ